MASNQQWNYAWVTYFVCVAVISFAGAGVLNEQANSGIVSVGVTDSVLTTGGYELVDKTGTTANTTSTPEYSSNPWNWGEYLKDVFSLLVFNISINSQSSVIMAYWWIIRLMFVYIPLLFLLISLFHSARKG